MTGWRSLNLATRTNGIGKTQNPFGKMRCIKFSGILRYKRILARRPDLVRVEKKKKKKRQQQKTK